MVCLLTVLEGSSAVEPKECTNVSEVMGLYVCGLALVR